MSDLVLKINKSKTITVPVTCQLFGDDDRVTHTLKLKVTFERTKAADWKIQHEEASNSTEDHAVNRFFFSKVTDIKGLPLERDGQPVEFDSSVFELIKDEQWLLDPINAALLSVNSGKRSDTIAKIIAKN